MIEKYSGINRDPSAVRIDTPVPFFKSEDTILRRFRRLTLRLSIVSLALLSPSKPTLVEVPQDKQETIADNLGYDIFDLGKRNDYQVGLVRDSENGSYIVHIGQIHSGQEDATSSERSDIVASQKHIESLLEDIAQTSNDQSVQVYAEAVVNNDYQDKLDEQRNVLDNITARPGCMTELALAYQQHVSTIKDERVKTFLRQRYNKKYSELFSTMSQAQSPEFFLDESEAQRIAPEISWDQPKEAQYISGEAINILAFEGKIKIQPAETAAANDAAMAAFNEIDLLCEEVESGRKDSQSARNEIIELEKEAFLAVHSVRDMIAVETAIEDQNNLDKGKIVIFGNMHNLENAVDAYNETHQTSVGLIKLEEIK